MPPPRLDLTVVLKGRRRFVVGDLEPRKVRLDRCVELDLVLIDEL